MISTDNTHQSKQQAYYMIVPEANRYRWLGRRTDAAGLVLAKVRYAPVAASWNALPVEWLPETEGRPACDFPIFHPIVRCISQRACLALEPFFAGSVEILPLEGAGGEYVGIHCIRWLDAADLSGVDQGRTSIHSTMFSPTLRASAIEGHDIVGVTEMIAKIFVSERVRRVVQEQQLTGLEFHPVPMR